MFRRREKHQSLPQNSVAQVSASFLAGDSMQEVWDRSFLDLCTGMSRLIEMTQTQRTAAAYEEEMQPVMEKIISAGWGLEELADKGFHQEVTRPLALSVRELIEGFANSQRERFENGFASTLAQIQPLLPES